MSNTLIVPQKLFEKLQIKKKRLLKNLSVKVVKETIQGIFIFNLARKSRKTVNAQQKAKKYALCSSFYKSFSDRRILQGSKG